MLVLGLLLGWGLTQVGCGRQRKAPPAGAHEGAPKPTPRRERPPKRPYEEPAPPEPVIPARSTRGPEPAKGLPRMALVIDDLGYAPPELVRRLCAQRIPLSVAVLPYLEFTRESATLAHEAGKEVLLHLPMEGGEAADPGPDALRISQDEATVRALTRKALLEVPYRKGVNNHMGSRFTADGKRMTWVVEELKREKLFFLDSRTTKETVAHETAQRLGLPSAQRQVFLDDDKSFEEIQKQWNRALGIARQEGHVIIIGHIYPETIEALERLVPQVEGQVRLVRVSELMR